MKVFVVLSHQLTDGQKDELQMRFNPESIIYMPEDLKSQWMNIPPFGEWKEQFIIEIKEWLKNRLTTGDIVIVQGEFGATFSLVQWLKMNDYDVYYATSERKVIEQLKPDGTVETIRRFQHVCFRQYPNIQ